MIVREAFVERAGRDFQVGQRIHVVTRTGSDEEAIAVIAESLTPETPVVFRLGGVTEITLGVLTLITERERDPDLWREAERAVGLVAIPRPAGDPNLN